MKNMIEPYLSQLNLEAKRPIIKACAKLAFEEIKKMKRKKPKTNNKELSSSSSASLSSSSSSSPCTTDDEMMKKRGKKNHRFQQLKSVVPETQNPDPLQLSDSFFTQSD